MVSSSRLLVVLLLDRFAIALFAVASDAAGGCIRKCRKQVACSGTWATAHTLGIHRRLMLMWACMHFEQARWVKTVNLQVRIAQVLSGRDRRLLAGVTL